MELVSWSVVVGQLFRVSCNRLFVHDPARGQMFIDPNITQDPAPFGGADTVLMSTSPREFRSFLGSWLQVVDSIRKPKTSLLVYARRFGRAGQLRTA